MKSIIYLISFLTVLTFSSLSFAADCPENIADQNIQEAVTKECIESLQKTDLLMSNVVTMLSPDNVSTIKDHIASLKNAVQLIASSGNKLHDSFIYAVSGFYDSFEPFHFLILIFFCAGIAKIVFNNRNNDKPVAGLIFERFKQFLISLGVSVSYIPLAGLVVYAAYNSWSYTTLNLYYTHERNIQSAVSIKDEIAYSAKQKTNAIIADVLKVSSCEYKREKEIAFNTSFDENNKFKEGKFQTCLIDQKNADVQKNIPGYYVSENMRKLSTCAMTEESVQTLTCGAVETQSTSAEIESAFKLAGPLLIQFNYMLDSYVCTNTKEIMDNQSHYTNGKDCIDFNPYTKQFTVTETGLPKFTEQKVDIAQLNSLVDQIYTVIDSGNVSVATKRASEVKFKGKEISMWSFLISLLTEHDKVTELKDAAKTAFDYEINFVDLIQYNEAQASIADDEQIARGGQTKLNKALRTEQVIDELTASYTVRDKGVDAIAMWIAKMGGDGYLENIGYNTESLHDFNTISSMSSATLTLFKQSFSIAAATKIGSKIMARFGTESDSEIPNETAIKAEKMLGLAGTFFSWICVTSFIISIIVFVNPIKIVFMDMYSYAIEVLKAVTIYPLMIFIDMFFNKTSWKEALLDRVAILFYLFAKVFMIWYKIILIFVVSYLVQTELLRALNSMETILGLFGADNDSFSGLLSKMIFLGFMNVLTAWGIAKVVSTVMEQTPQIEAASMFGSGSSMNFNINGKQDRNAYNSYIKGGR